MIAAKPTLSFLMRFGTLDEVAVRETLSQNAYDLPPRFSKSDVIVDVGAHIGSFALACLARGCGEVWCYEPDEENFSYLQKNLSTYSLGVHLSRKAVWRSDCKEPVTFTGYPDHATACGSCVPGVVVGGMNKRIPVDTIGLDEVIEKACQTNGRIRLLKIDAEGAEFPALGTCTMLDRVEEICGEMHTIEQMANLVRVPRFQRCDMQELGDFLYDEGFKDVFSLPMSDARNILFWAKR